MEEQQAKIEMFNKQVLALEFENKAIRNKLYALAECLMQQMLFE